LNLLLDALNTEVAWPAGKLKDGRSTLRHCAREMRRSLKRHPWASALRADDPEYGPDCTRIMELLLATLSEFGLDIRTATRSLGALFMFVNGFVTAETIVAGRQQATGRQRLTYQSKFSKTVLTSGEFPHVARFVEMDAELPDDDSFERALKWILDGIETDLNKQRKIRPAKSKRRG
jgi:hypothetical protein